ncbi:MAG TPA: hypothetical protein VKB86_17370, partial [Pyrinomonadaceae bacterium]|nr:hypothetical protein [Pyrinomonadaceae bacterium]
MNRIRQIFSLALVFLLAGLSASAQTQRRTYRVSNYQVRQLISRIQSRTDIFRGDVSAALNSGSVNTTYNNGDISAFVTDFQSAVTQLNDRLNNRQAVNADVQNVLDRAALIDSFVRSNRLGVQAERDWANIRLDLNTLARDYGIAWNWNTQTYPQNNYPQNNYPPVNTASGGLTGTYTLDTARSDDARSIAERAVRSLPYNDRQRVLDRLTARLESPTTLAIDRRGRNVTIASSRAPQFSFEADGAERVETSPNGRSIRVRSSLYGDQLSVSTTGDTGNDFSVTFEPIEAGRRLRVVRRITETNLSAPVTVVSVYDKTSDVAQLNIYNGGPGYSTNNYPSNTGTVAANGDFVVPDGTEIVAVLNNNLTTRDTRDNDRFTMTVRSPYQYEGATINGYVSNVSRSGRITGRSQMTLNFDSITLRNGQTYR